MRCAYELFADWFNISRDVTDREDFTNMGNTTQKTRLAPHPLPQTLSLVNARGVTQLASASLSKPLAASHRRLTLFGIR